jgi:hypothetical protein
VAIPDTCIVRDCERKPQVKEVYDRPFVYTGGNTDHVCGAHTDRFGGKYPLVAREVLTGEIVYAMGANG